MRLRKGSWILLLQQHLPETARDLEKVKTIQICFLSLALILIFLVLQLSLSFIDPLIIMITVPLAMAGALLSLTSYREYIEYIFSDRNDYVDRIVTKNGILIVDFANKKQLLGENKNGECHDASVLRLRPILMTSLLLALGEFPLALSLEQRLHRAFLWVLWSWVVFHVFDTDFICDSCSLHFLWARKKSLKSRTSIIKRNNTESCGVPIAISHRLYCQDTLIRRAAIRIKH